MTAREAHATATSTMSSASTSSTIPQHCTLSERRADIRDMRNGIDDYITNNNNMPGRSSLLNRKRTSQSASRRNGEWFRNKLDSTALLALCYLWLAPFQPSLGTQVSAASSGNNLGRQHRAQYLRNIQDHSPLFFQQQDSAAYTMSSVSSSPPPRRLQEETPGTSTSSPEMPPDPGNSTSSRAEAIATLLTRSGYTTAFGEEPLCWKSVNATASPDVQVSKIYDADMLFPNPLVEDFAFVPGEEVVLPSCFDHSSLSLQKPEESLRGERLRTHQFYDYTVNVTLDFEAILAKQGGTVGDAVVTAFPNVSQVALQVMHCVLGKSGVCTPFLHEQAYAREYLETGKRPQASQPGSSHGDTHIHSNFVKITLEPNQTILDRSITVPLQVNVEGDYFVIAAVQFYTGDAATNIAYYRWDMANAMSYEDRLVTYQNPAEILRVSDEVRWLSYAIIGAASLVILFLIYQAIKHREEQVLKLSQGEFLVVFLISALAATVCTFLMEPKNDLYCNLGSTLVLLSVQLMYAITAGRLWRINAVISPLLVEHMRKKTKWTNRFVGAVDALSNSVTLRMKKRENRELRRSIPKWQLAVVVGMFVSPQVILQIAALIWQPQELVIDYNSDESEGRYVCQTNAASFGSTILLYSFLALLFLIVIVLCVAYSSRKLPSLFNETQVIYDSTFISVVLILLGIGIVALTDTPTTSPDVQYMVWIVVTLSITLNSTLRIMIPKLKMIWKGEQVIVSKLVSDHHRKKREKDFKMNQQQSGRDIMHNVTGMGDDYTKLSFYNQSYGPSQMSLNYQSAPSLHYSKSSDHQPMMGSTSESIVTTSTQGRPQHLFPQVSMGDMTTKMSNVVETEELGAGNAGENPNDVGTEDAKTDLDESLKHDEMNANKNSRDTASTEMEESMELEELTRQPSTGKKAETVSHDSKRSTDSATNTTADAKKAKTPDVSADSDTETVGSSKPIRRRLWPPLVNHATHADESKSQEAKGNRMSLFHPLGNAFLLPMVKKAEGDNAAESQTPKGTPRRRQSAKPSSNRKKSPTRGRAGLDTKSAKRGEGIGGSSGFRTQSQPERMKVAPNETPARRLVLRMIDLQEQLSSVTSKIMSGLVVAPDDWDLLTSLNEKLHTTFEKDVDFTWREPTEPKDSPKSPPPNESRGRDRRRRTLDSPPTQITLHQNGKSPPVSPKGQRTKLALKRGSGENPAEIAVVFRNIVDVRDRRKSIVKHRKCFVGKDAVDSLVYSNLASSREEAVLIGRAMVKDMHLFKTVNGDLEFDDDSRLYRFVDLDDFWSSSEEEEEPESVNFPTILEGPNLGDKALAFKETVVAKDCVYRMQTFKNVFIGAEAVDSLVYANVAATRWEAVQLGRKLARDCHLFGHVTDDHDFEDEYLFYRYLDADDSKNSQFFELNSIAENSHYTTPEDNIRNPLADKADAFRMYVDARNRKYRLQLMKDVFVGSEAVSALVFAGVAPSRKEAVELGRTLMKELRLFTTVRGDDEFSDKRHSYYRFNDSHLRRRSLDAANPKGKIADEATLHELRGMGEVFQQLVEVKDRKYRFRRYKNCFVGAEAVDHMIMSGMAETRVEAVQLGRAMARELDLFKHVSVDKPFSDEYLFYQFCDGDHSASSLQSDGSRAMAISRRPSDHIKKLIQSEAFNSSCSSNEDSFALAFQNSARSGASNDMFNMVGSEADGFNDSRVGNLEIVHEAGESKSGDFGLQVPPTPTSANDNPGNPLVGLAKPKIGREVSA